MFYSSPYQKSGPAVFDVIYFEFYRSIKSETDLMGPVPMSPIVAGMASKKANSGRQSGFPLPVSAAHRLVVSARHRSEQRS
jgi:hypothetical protein